MDLNTKLLSSVRGGTASRTRERPAAQPLRIPQASGDRGRTLCENPVPSSNHAVKVIVDPMTSNDLADLFLSFSRRASPFGLVAGRMKSSWLNAMQGWVSASHKEVTCETRAGVASTLTTPSTLATPDWQVLLRKRISRRAARHCEQVFGIAPRQLK